MSALEDKWEGQIYEVEDNIEGMTVFVVSRSFCSHMECIEFADKHINGG